MPSTELTSTTWRKSSYSGNTGNCVEVTSCAQWRKSRRSSGNRACVEVVSLSQSIAVRDSKNPHAPALVFSPGQWQEFVRQV